MDSRAAHEAQRSKRITRRISLTPLRFVRGSDIVSNEVARRGEREGWAIVVLQPAVATGLWLGGIKGEIDRAAEVNPAHQGTAVFISQGRDLASFYGFRRRHDAAGVGEVDERLAVADLVR